MEAAQFSALKINPITDNGKLTCQAPSNIALVKYWGKREVQIPENTSISFTLSSCKTTTTLEYSYSINTSEDFNFSVYLDNKREENFEPKIETFFKRIEPYFSFLKSFTFTIKTTNSFPHSSGIASSASGMSALAMCLVELEKQLAQNPKPQTYYSKKASFIARLGSGSASRSVEGPMMIWGLHNEISQSTNNYAIAHTKIHPVFETYQDTILLVDKGEKQVSSTVGHNLMHGHPFAQQRFKQAQNNMIEMLGILEQGNLSKFITLVELEALTLHAMMMSSNPYFILMKPNTLHIIHKIWAFRKASKLNLCFTLDAGANVHVLYPKSEASETVEFIKNELVAYCKNGEYLCDSVGVGASIQMHT